MRQNVLNRFAAHGIDVGRLIPEGASPRAELLATYQRVDIALDPFPYPGGTTSVEGLWMGVPVITKRGDRFLSHIGETIAHNAGLSDWVAVDEDDYVAKAVYFASDLDRLANIQASIIVKSPNSANSIFNLKVMYWWERPPGRDKLNRGQEAAPTK